MFNVSVMKKIIFLSFFLGCAFFSYGQVGIGTTKPNASTQLEIVSQDKGVLIPQVALISATDATTISNGNVESLLVYNTSTEVDLQPGYYYWSKGKWHRILTDDVHSNNGNGKAKMVDNGNGTYSYTNDDGSVIVIQKSGGETITKLVNNGNGSFTYTDEKGIASTIKGSDLETLTTLSLDLDNKNLDYTDEKGTVTKIDLGAAVKNLETKTTLTKNADGSFTYVNEAGTAITLDGFISQAANGLSQNGQTVELGGSLDKPTQITTSATNTLAIQGMQPGSPTDNIVVIDSSTGVLKSLPAISNSTRKIEVYTASENQNTYTTPFPISDTDKIQVFRNGVEIDFRATVNTNSITLDFSKYSDDKITSCFAGDEIKIYQWK